MLSKQIIGFQGSPGANSHLACQKFYPNTESQSFTNFCDVFEAAESGKIEFGMIPLENSYAGRVSEIHELLKKHDVSIVAEHFFPINHYLAGIKGAKLNEIKKVFSHPQALSQCQNNLKQLKVAVNEFSNTAEAAKFIANSNDKTWAAICSSKACEIHNLEIIKENMQDSGSDNLTIFVVIAKNNADIAGLIQEANSSENKNLVAAYELNSATATKSEPNLIRYIDPKIAPTITTLLFTIRNIPGSLYKALGGFATNGVSLVKLESYIPGGFSKQAQFFISIEGHPSQSNVALALEELDFFSKDVKFLGVYYADPARFSKE